jgi:TRAP-type C4-dicarboxylate transport system substrate-binding protein
MRKRASSAIVGALALGAISISATADAKELIYGSQLSPRHGFINHAIPPFFDAVKKATNGEIEWKHVGGGSLVGFSTAVDGAKDGLVDGGFGIAVYIPAKLPSTALIHSLFFPGNDPVAMTGAALETVMLNCPSCQKEFRENGVVFLAGYDTTAYELICRDDITSIDQIKGLKIRASGAGVELMKMAGATPVAMSPASATTALQRGTLDCVHGSPSWLRSYGYWDVAKSVLHYPTGVSGPTLSFIISRNTWKGMTPQQRKAHVDNAAILGAQTTVNAYLKDDAAVIEQAKKKGVKFNPGGQGVRDLFKRFYMESKEKVAKDYTDKFGVPGAEIVANLEKAQEKWLKISEEVGTDIGKITAALNREIYSKIDPEKY